jgi:hypothetical protein
MSTSQLKLKLQPSKSYLAISLCIYALCLLLPWWRLDTFLINVAITALIFISAITFFPKFVLLSKETSITEITLGEGNTSLSAKDGETKFHSNYLVTYQSRLLIIIRFGKTYVPIFKDSVQENNLSSLNRFLNIR